MKAAGSSKSISRLFVASLLAIVAVIAVDDVCPQVPGAPPISGVVYSQSRGPLAGCTISLVHPAIGRSAPTFSGPGGYYYFGNVPPRPDPYYVEAYWGNQLLFRGQIVYQGFSVRFDIPLP